jgi:putative ABC transport system substrate-binding protein
MKRRDFITVLCGAALWPVGVRAQRAGKTYRMAMVHSNRPVAEMTEDTPVQTARTYRDFFRELRRLGYVEGENLMVERYSGGGKAAAYPELAEAIVHSTPDLIFAGGGMASYLKAATSTIPIVSFFSGDVVSTGLVASLARPGGNITGVAVDAGAEIWGKRFELLRQVIPGLSRVGFLATRPNYDRAEAVSEAARQVGITTISPLFDVSGMESEYRRVFAAMLEQGAEAVMVSDEGENNANVGLIVDLIAQARLPALYPIREATEAGGLMAYSIDFTELFRVMARQIDQIFRGRSPADIPIYLPTKFELVVNLKTAKALALSLPTLLVATADQVIE